MITVNQINELRQQTQVSMMLCKQALEATGGDFDKAKEWLRSQGGNVAGDTSVVGYTLFENGKVLDEGETPSFVYSDGHTTVNICGYSGSTPRTLWGSDRHMLVCRPVKA